MYNKNNDKVYHNSIFTVTQGDMSTITIIDSARLPANQLKHRNHIGFHRAEA